VINKTHVISEKQDWWHLNRKSQQRELRYCSMAHRKWKICLLLQCKTFVLLFFMICPSSSMYTIVPGDLTGKNGHYTQCTVCVHNVQSVYTMYSLCTQCTVCVNNVQSVYTMYSLCTHKVPSVYTMYSVCKQWTVCVHNVHTVYSLCTQCTVCVHVTMSYMNQWQKCFSYLGRFWKNKGVPGAHNCGRYRWCLPPGILYRIDAPPPS